MLSADQQQPKPINFSAKRGTGTELRLTKRARVYYFVFMLALLISWSPSNAAAYATPFLVIGLYIFLSNSEITLRRTLLWYLGWFVLVGVYGLIYLKDYAWQSALLSIITYSAFAVPIVIPAPVAASEALWHKLLIICRWVLIIEASLGIVQAVYGFTQTGSFSGANGDYVEGTIHPWLSAEMAFSNPMFAVNIVFLLLAIAPSLLREHKGWIAFGLGSIALVLASVLHVLMILAIAMTVAFFWFFPGFLFRYKTGCLASSITAIILLFSINLLSWGPLIPFVKATMNLESPRAQVLYHVLRDIPDEYPLFPLIGLGPGQFASRAGLIGTGLYFGRPTASRSLPLLVPDRSTAFRVYVEDYWLNPSIRPGYKSSATAPFFSWQSLYTEFGVIGVIVVMGFIVWLGMRIKRRAITFERKIQAIFTGAGIVFLALVGIQENYWEISQAILPGLMLLKVQYALLNCNPNSKLWQHTQTTINNSAC
ncbi:MAG: hypothetical protein IT328_14480 [Caldilineaceae bacterium]|nr:hypothetical protein [Caldilineaceae bacterium]